MKKTEPEPLRFQDKPIPFVTFFRVVQALENPNVEYFAQAAELCGLTPSHVAEALSLLEDRVGASLFVLAAPPRLDAPPKRTTVLSPEGRALFDLIGPLLGPLIKHLEEFRRGAQTSDVRIAAHQAVMQYDVLPALARARENDPSLLQGVRLVTLNRATSRIIDLLRTWGIEWGIVSGNARDLRENHPAFSEARLRYTRYHTFPTMLFLPPNAQALGIAVGRPPTMAEIARGPLVLVGRYARFRRRLDGCFEKAGATPNIRFEVDSGATVIAAVNAGLGMAVVHQITIPPELRKSDRAIKLPAGLFGDNELGVLQLEDRKLSRPAERLLEAVMKGPRSG